MVDVSVRISLWFLTRICEQVVRLPRLWVFMSLTFCRSLPPELRAGEHDGVDELLSAEPDGGGALHDAAGLQRNVGGY